VVISAATYFAQPGGNGPNVAERAKPVTPAGNPRDIAPVDSDEHAIPSPENIAVDEPEPEAGNGNIEEHNGEGQLADSPTNKRYDELYKAFLQRFPNAGSQEEILALRPEWVDEVALGFRPVATSLEGAINTLRSTLPPSNKSAREGKPQAGALDLASAVAGIA
jgi:hypothetical protein